MTSDALSFAGLVVAIQQTHVAFSAQASKAVNISLTLRNWFIGQYIAEYELKGADRASYGNGLLEALSAALRDEHIGNTGRRQLYNYLGFYRRYPQIVRTPSAQTARVLPPDALAPIVRTASAQSGLPASADPEQLLGRLSYSHFEQLVEIADPLKRLFYEVEILRGNWSVRELKRQLATQYFERSSLSADKDALTRLTHQLAEPQSPLHVIRDPYVFEFLGLRAQEVT